MITNWVVPTLNYVSPHCMGEDRNCVREIWVKKRKIKLFHALEGWCMWPQCTCFLIQWRCIECFDSVFCIKGGVHTCSVVAPSAWHYLNLKQIVQTCGVVFFFLSKELEDVDYSSDAYICLCHPNQVTTCLRSFFHGDWFCVGWYQDCHQNNR